MAKRIENITEINPDDGIDTRRILIIRTDDDVSYVFEKTISNPNSLFKQTILRFSHRYYPNREGKNKRDHRNYRLPSDVIRCLREEGSEYFKPDGMITEAIRNHNSVQNNDTKTQKVV